MTNSIKFYLLVLAVFIVFTNEVKAQQTNKLDTIYYLADTLNIPVKDRIVEIGIERPFKYFAIQIKCLKYDQKPVFLCNLDEQFEVVNRKTLKKTKLISIVNLIELAKDAGGEAFNYKHVAYIFELDKKKYIKRKVRLLRPMRHDITY